MGNINLTNFYYDFVVGEYPENKADYIKTKMLFEYLLESGCSQKFLLTKIIAEFENKNSLTEEDIPDSLWEGSLLIRNKFYYHKELQILSPPPTWDNSYPFYIEMKIQYSIEDVLDYFIETFNINKDWINKEKELGSIKYLLNNYIKYGFIEPVDYLLHLIDYVKSLDCKISSIYDLRKYETECIEYLELDIANAKSSNKNKVIWRMSVCGI